jgi:hypothetical protein
MYGGGMNDVNPNLFPHSRDNSRRPSETFPPRRPSEVSEFSAHTGIIIIVIELTTMSSSGGNKSVFSLKITKEIVFTLCNVLIPLFS